jgi:Na+/citrate or Na+/malate symporter
MTITTARSIGPTRGSRVMVGALAATVAVAGVFTVLSVTSGGGRLSDAVGLVVVATSIAMLVAYVLGVPVALMLERRFAERPVLRLAAYVVAGLAAGALVGLWFGRDVESMLWCSALGVLAALTGALAARWAQRLSSRRARLTSRWASVALVVALAAAWFPIATSGGPAQ